MPTKMELDLFITNYYQEFNALYTQQLPGLFSDQSRQAQLQDPSYSMLGFGTQFLDADLDGRLDLVLTNGHLDDFSYLGQPYQMRPQFFHNAGQAKFVELNSATLGPFFARPALGRSLARLDWNRDGREDFIVSHLDCPASLLTNLTQPVGNYVAFELRGVVSSRDAIGTIVTVHTKSGRSLTRQLTAGDGYQASNQRQLLFGLGDADAIERVTVRWPGGASQEFAASLPLNTHYLWVEGESGPTALSR